MRRYLTSVGIVALACATAAAQPPRGGLRTVPGGPPIGRPIGVAQPPQGIISAPVARQSAAPFAPPPVSPILGRHPRTFGGFGGYYSPFYAPWGYSTPYYSAGPSIQIINTNVLPAPEIDLTPSRSLIPAPPLPNQHPTRARLELRAPAGAEVFINDKKIEMGGPVRNFESPELKPGESYTFDVRLRWEENGKPVEEKRTLSMRGGDFQSLQYLGAPAATTRLEK